MVLQKNELCHKDLEYTIYDILNHLCTPLKNPKASVNIIVWFGKWLIMTNLVREKCEACHAEAPKVTELEIKELYPQVNQWKLIKVNGVLRLERSFHFRNFAEALEFTNSVGDLAETQGHHPRLITEWGNVTASWWTHKINGLHRNDFIMAAKTNGLYKRSINKKS